MNKRIVFWGTPEFAKTSLEALVEAGYNVVAACCQPDRPKGRGGKVQACPVKVYALEKGIPVLQFERFRRAEGVEALTQIAPDLFVTAAFGQILSQKLLDIPPMGTINVHASLLPKHRGAAPINWSIIQGDETVGVTTMFSDAGMDTGDMLQKAQTQVREGETAGELTERLAQMGAELLIKTLKDIEAGVCPRTPQDPSEATYEPLLEKTLGELDWQKSAQEIDNLVRGVNPWPGAYTFIGGEVLKVWKTKVHPREEQARAGEILAASPKEGLFVQTGAGVLEIVEMQAAGSKRMPAKDYMRGHPIAVGSVLGKEKIDE